MERIFTLRRKNNKFKILFDMDDVLADFIGYIVPILNERFNKSYKVEDITNWSLKEYYGEGLKDILEEDNLFVNLKPKNDVIKEFPKIYRNDKYDVWIATSCTSPKGYIEKIIWLQKIFPDFPISRVLPCSEKDVIWADALVDDGLHNLLSYELIGEPIVYDMAHNRYFEDGKPVTYRRVKSIKEIRKYLEEKTNAKSMRIA